MTEVSRRTLIVVGFLALVTLGYLLSIYQEKNQLMAEEENMKETLSSCLSNHHRCRQDLLTCKDETTQQQPRSDSLTQLLQQKQTTADAKVGHFQISLEFTFDYIVIRI